MQNAIVPFDAAKMAVSLKQVSREASPMASFLKMEKSGAWVFGIEGSVIKTDAEFMVNPGGVQHGYVAWRDTDKHGGSAEKLGEVMMPITEPLAETGPVPATGKSWDFQLGLQIKGCSGATDGIDMIWRSTSVGGKRAIAELAGIIGDRMAAGESKLVPVVTLASESYKHKTYGKIHNPVLTVVRWVGMPAAGTAPKVAAKPAKAPAAKKKAA